MISEKLRIVREDKEASVGKHTMDSSTIPAQKNVEDKPDKRMNEKFKSVENRSKAEALDKDHHHTTGSAADWTEMRVLTVGSLKINPKYQRLLDKAWVQEIADNFNPDLVQVIQVSCRDGQYFTVDGQHTTEGIKIKFNDDNYPVLCKIYYGLTEKEEGEMFYLFNKCKKKMNASSMLKAQEFYGDHEVNDFFQRTRDAGFVIDAVKRVNCQYGIAAVSTARNCFRGLGPELYVRMLNLLRGSWDGARWSLTQKMLSAMSAFIATFGDQVDDRLFIRRFRSVSESDLTHEAGKFAAQGGTLSLASAMVTFYNKGRRSGKLAHEMLVIGRR